jgi:hypothetical protein
MQDIIKTPADLGIAIGSAIRAAIGPRKQPPAPQFADMLVPLIVALLLNKYSFPSIEKN